MTHRPLHRPRRRVVPLVAVLVTLSLGSVACGGGGEAVAEKTSGPRRSAPATNAPSTTGPSTTTDDSGTTSPPDSGFPADWQPAPLEWGPCRTASVTECATLAVPLAWSDPQGPQIDLAIGRIPATGTAKGSLLTNPGGPGGSGLEFLGYAPFSSEVSQDFDLVSWDPRGVGESTAVTCGDSVPAFLAKDPSPDDPGEQQSIESAAAAVADECGRADGKLLPHISTPEVARDMEAIRLALGGEPLNYVGFSYGTHIGLEYAERFGGNIRTMVLDGVVDPALGFEEFLLGQTAAFQAAFEENALRCGDAGVSACGVADLTAAYDAVAAEVEVTPLPGGPKGVGPAQLATAATFSAYLQDGWTDLGQALADAANGDGAALWDLASSYYDFGSYGAYAGVVCTDTPHPDGDAAFRAFYDRAVAVSPRFGPSVANEMLPCATWPAPPAGTPAPVTAPDAPPILVIGNTGDPATPLENAQQVADTLVSGHLVVVEMDGHTAYGTNQCATDIIDKYLLTAKPPAEGVRC